jgi:hypothetical protein
MLISGADIAFNFGMMTWISGNFARIAQIDMMTLPSNPFRVGTLPLAPYNREHRE